MERAAMPPIARTSSKLRCRRCRHEPSAPGQRRGTASSASLCRRPRGHGPARPPPVRRRARSRACAETSNSTRVSPSSTRLPLARSPQGFGPGSSGRGPGAAGQPKPLRSRFSLHPPTPAHAHAPRPFRSRPHDDLCREIWRENGAERPATTGGKGDGRTWPTSPLTCNDAPFRTLERPIDNWLPSMSVAFTRQRAGDQDPHRPHKSPGQRGCSPSKAGTVLMLAGWSDHNGERP